MSTTEQIKNFGLSAILLTLILGPVGLVAFAGGLREGAPEKGLALGARLNEFRGTLAETKQGEIREITFTTFWGQVATYQNIGSVTNEGPTARQYLVEVLNVQGGSGSQLVTASFEPSSSPKITLLPGESAWIKIKVVAQPLSDENAPERTPSKANLAIWIN